MRYQEWSDRVSAARNRADRVLMLMRTRWLKVIEEAGLDPSCGAIHTHNSMVSFDSGDPWPGVDYSKVRYARRLEQLMLAPGRIVDRYAQRTYPR
jgi:hypothetical protein